MTDVIEQRCPFLGLVDDEDTSISYPSEWNVCHKCHGNPSPNYGIQEELCLTPEHAKCVLYLSDGMAWMPGDMKNSDGTGKPVDPNAKRKLIVSAILVALITFFATVWYSYSTQINEVVEVITKPTSTITIVPTFTNTPVIERPTVILDSPTRTPFPSPTKLVFTKCGHALDQEFGSDNLFLVHQIKDGESVEKLLAAYGVTYEEVIAINYFVPQPIWVGFPVIIPNKENMYSNSKTYQALELNENDITILELSLQLGIEADLFTSLNGLDGECNSFTGWFIVPREKVKYE